MFEIKGSAVVATMGDLKNRSRETIEKAQEKPVYLVRDGEPVGGIVSMAMLEVLQEALEDRYLARVAQNRLDAIRQGKAGLLDEEEFWARADEVIAKQP